MLVQKFFWQPPPPHIFGKHFYYLVKILGKVGQNMMPPPPMLMSSRRPCKSMRQILFKFCNHAQLINEYIIYGIEMAEI
jgi:hypothetical protein